MNIFSVYHLSVVLISIVFLISAIFLGGYRGGLVCAILLGFLHIMLRKLGLRWDEMNRDREECVLLKDRLADTHQKLDEKIRMLTEKTAESNIQRRITEAMISTMELSKILAIILEAVIKTLRHDRAILFLLNEEGKKLEARQSAGFAGGKLDCARILINKKDNPFSQSMKEARPMIIRNASEYRAVLSFLTDKDDAFPPEVLISPMIAKERSVGMILVDHLKTKRPFEEADMRDLLTYTHRAGIAVLNARLFQTEKHFHEELAREVEKARKKLLEAQNQLIQSERLAALGEMAAVVAHEVKNPMASIRACTQALEHSVKDEKKIDHKYLVYIRKEIDRLDKIVKSILTYSKTPVPRIVSYDLNILVEETLDFMDKEIQLEHVHLTRNLDRQLPRIAIDPEGIKQILINLLDNALFFLKTRDEKKITVSTAKQDDRAVLAVEDTGGGIDPAVLPKIFEPFFTTKTQGTGLGLAVCQRIIESQHGIIEVHNVPGSGIRMDVIFAKGEA